MSDDQPSWGPLADTLDSLSETAARRARAAQDDREASQPPSCGLCRGVGLVETDSAGQGTWRPCDRCNPEGHRRWREGHWGPDHRCTACTDLAKADRPRRGER